MYLTHNEEKTIAGKILIRTLNKRTYKYIKSISKNVCINTLADLVNKYSNTCHWSIKMKPVDVISKTCIEFGRAQDEKYTKFEVGDHVRILKYKNISSIWSVEVFVIKKV